MKSILKPTIPISPMRRNSPLTKPRNMSPKKPTPDTMQNDWKTSKFLAESNRMPDPSEEPSQPISSVSGLLSPSQYRTRIFVRSEEEQQAAAKERERHELLAQKEARRKSLGETDGIYSYLEGFLVNRMAIRSLADLGSKSKGLVRT